MKPTKILAAVLLSATIAACGGTPETATAETAELTSSQVFQAHPEAGPFTSETYSCLGSTWRWRQYVRQYASGGSYYTGFVGAVNKPGSIDYSKNEVTMYCSADVRDLNYSTSLTMPTPTTGQPDVVCDIYSHFAGSGWGFSVRTKMPWNLSFYSPIVTGFPYGYWDAYLTFPPQFSADWGTGYGTSCFAMNVPNSHQFPID